jgi:flavoprotein
MVIRRKKRVQGLVTNIIMKQNQKAQVTNYRVLRDRKQQEIQEELEMMINHQQNKIENEYL